MCTDDNNKQQHQEQQKLHTVPEDTKIGRWTNAEQARTSSLQEGKADEQKLALVSQREKERERERGVNK